MSEKEKDFEDSETDIECETDSDVESLFNEDFEIEDIDDIVKDSVLHMPDVEYDKSDLPMIVGSV